MEKILSDYPLKSHNSFGLNVKANAYISFSTIEEIHQFLEANNIFESPFLILGEGSNILFTDNYKGLILHPLLKGIELIDETDSFVELRVSAGENWDNFVAYCVENAYNGIENLSLIPGSVGSAPVQNIGAYGVEVKDYILQVEGIELKSNKKLVINAEDCRFEYRQSIFKQELKNKFIITHVIFRLNKHENFNLGYGSIEQLFRKKEKRDLKALRETIIEIRESKLPDPAKFGNAGSFFKNPVIDKNKFYNLKANFPDVPFYSSGEMIKIPAAWLIEKSGWKGFRENDAGTWPLQPLVIVNYGNASGNEIYNLSERILESVRKTFRIELEREVNVIPPGA
jgi:UDP-N-acetylmuramate dehydrogenase